MTRPRQRNPRARPVVVATKEDLTNDSDILGDSKVSTTGMEGFEAPELEMQQAMNPGSSGHPYSCGPACKYALKSRGCKRRHVHPLPLVSLDPFLCQILEAH